MHERTTVLLVASYWKGRRYLQDSISLKGNDSYKLLYSHFHEFLCWFCTSETGETYPLYLSFHYGILRRTFGRTRTNNEEFWFNLDLSSDPLRPMNALQSVFNRASPLAQRQELLVVIQQASVYLAVQHTSGAVTWILSGLKPE